MYKIENTGYGLKLTFADFIKADEMKQWSDESAKALTKQKAAFGVLVDMRTLKPLPPDAQDIMVQGQKKFKEKGMNRSVVILANAIVTGQFKRLAKESGIDAWERYIDASAHPDWEKIGEQWLVQSKDPDK